MIQLSIPVLVSLAASQMLFSRLLSRVGIFIPKSGTVQEVFSWLVKIGNLAGNLVMVLALVLVISLAVRLLWSKAGKPLLSLSMLLLPALVIWAALAGGQLTNNQFMALAGLTLVITGDVGIRAGKRAGDWRESFWLATLAGIISLSLIAGFLTALGQNLGSFSLVSFGTIINNTGQWLLAVSGFIIFGAFSVKPGRVGVGPVLRKSGMALLAAGGFFGVYFVDRYSMTTLLQWGVGLNMVFPVWLYATSLGCFVIGLSSLAARGELGRSRAWGTLLVVLAGYQMPFTSDLLLVALGLALLAFPELFRARANQVTVEAM